MDQRPRFLTLEAMRGLAAIGVVAMHGERAFGVASPVGAYLAVDFFFLLSGFIMAHAYGDKLDAGLPRRAFLRARLVRLYPLYLVGTLSTVAIAGASVVVRHDHSLWDFTHPVHSLPFALWMLPDPASDLMFPLNVPAWSLLFELVANAAFAFRTWRRRMPLLLTVGVSAAFLIGTAALHGNLDLGWNTASFGPGLARVFFSFSLGVLLHRVRHRIRLPAVLGAAAPAVLVVLLYVDPQGSGRAAYDVAFVTIASPLLLLAGAWHEPAGVPVQRVYAFLGTISYPLYALHHSSLLAWVGTIERHVAPGWLQSAACVAVVAGLVAVAAVAAMVERRVRSALAMRRGAALRLA